MDRQPLLSIVAPVYMEQDVLPEFYSRLKSAIANLSITYEIILVNDGSTDHTAEILEKIHHTDPSVKVITFSRNFGHQVAITAGIDHAFGDAVIVMDSDLQDPPELIPEMVEKWSEGYEVVYCVRNKRKGEGGLKKFLAALFYRVISRLSETKLPVSTGDFRLMDKKVVEVLRGMREGNRYIRGLVAWIGFSQTALEYERDPRYAGRPKYNFRKSLKLAIDGITSFSEKPLVISSIIGMIITGVSFLIGIYLILCKTLYPTTVLQGWTSLMVLVLFIGGVQLLSMGVIGQYIGRIYREIKQRPLYVIAGKSWQQKDKE